MSSKVELTGGAFQDSEGNLLENGYLLMSLSQDSSVDGLNICAGVEVKINLDASGNAVAGQSVWGDDVLLPINSYYRVTGYTTEGQPVWGPNNQQIVGGPTFDLGSWIPNQVISWSPSTAAITLLNNGSQNSSQNRLNLESTGATITITDEGGGNINLESTGGGTEFSTAGEGWFLGGQDYSPLADDTGGFWTTAGGTVYVVQVILESKWVISALRALCITGSAGGFTAGLYTEDGNTKLIDAGAAAFDLSHSRRVTIVTLGSPVTLDPGVYWFAFAADNGNGGSVLHHIVGQWFPDFFNGASFPGTQTGVVRYGTAANLLSSGALPSTLGAITPFAEGSFSTADIPAIMFEV